VIGDVQEIGTVSRREIKNHTFMSTTDLSDLEPAIGYSWVGKKEISDFEQFALDIG
jgi:hypothetical protein